MPKRIIQHRDMVMAAALIDYQKREMTTEQIAAKHGISTATLTVWAKQAKLPLRNRGRKRQEIPTPRQMEIVKLATLYTLDNVGARFGMHKQSIHRIVKRWRNWYSLAQTRKPQFAPGDMLLWRGKKFIVLDANHQDGTLIDDRGKVYKHFSWNGGRIPKKIGVNPKYVVPASDVAVCQN